MDSVPATDRASRRTPMVVATRRGAVRIAQLRAAPRCPPLHDCAGKHRTGERETTKARKERSVPQTTLPQPHTERHRHSAL